MKAPDIRLKRLDAQLSQRQVADALGWNPNSIVDIERGRIGIDDETHEEISEAIARLKNTPKEKERRGLQGVGIGI